MFYNSIPTTDKGILICGYTYLQPKVIIPDFFDTINHNALIVKIDSNRKISWIKIFGGSSDDIAYNACQTPDGGYAVLAETSSFDGDVTSFKGGADIWLLRLDSIGNLLWEKTYGSSDEDNPMSIANTPDHGFIISGTSNGDDDDVPFHYGSVFSYDWLVIKTDSLGNKQWCKDLGGTDDEVINGSVLAIDSSYYLISASLSVDHDCTDSLWHPGINTGEDIYILNLDTAGNVLWDSSYGGSNADAVNYAMYDTRDSTIVLAASTASDDYMVTGQHGCDAGDFWIVKIAKSGKLLWEKTLGSTQQEDANSICAAPGGGYMAYGFTYPVDCYDSAIGDIGNQDCWMFLLNDTGSITANKVFGGVNEETPNAIVPFLNGYAAFGTSSSIAFTEGSNYGNFDSVGGGFVSYIGYWPLAVNNLNSPSLTISVYPNPAQNSVSIAIRDAGKLSIINSIGQTVYKEQTGLQTIWQVQTREWPAGIYLVT